MAQQPILPGGGGLQDGGEAAHQFPLLRALLYYTGHGHTARALLLQELEVADHQAIIS